MVANGDAEEENDPNVAGGFFGAGAGVDERELSELLMLVVRPVVVVLGFTPNGDAVEENNANVG